MHSPFTSPRILSERRPSSSPRRRTGRSSGGTRTRPASAAASCTWSPGATSSPGAGYSSLAKIRNIFPKTISHETIQKMYSRNSPGIKEPPLEAAVNSYVRHFQIPGGTISRTGNVMMGGDTYSYIVCGMYNMLFKKPGAIPNQKNCDGGYPDLDRSNSNANHFDKKRDKLYVLPKNLYRFSSMYIFFYKNIHIYVDTFFPLTFISLFNGCICPF